MNIRTAVLLGAAAALVAGSGLQGGATARPDSPKRGDDPLVKTFQNVSRSTVWQQTD